MTFSLASCEAAAVRASSARRLSSGLAGASEGALGARLQRPAQSGQHFGEELRRDEGIDVTAQLALRQRARWVDGDLVLRRALHSDRDVGYSPPCVLLVLAE